MIRFFRISGTFQWIFIILWVFILRLPYVFGLSVFEQPRNGAQGPLSELLFTASSYLISSERLSVFVGSFLLVLAQALLVQRIFLKNQVLPDYRTLPSIVYVCVASLVPSFYFLSPESVGAVFLIPVLGSVWEYMHTGTDENDAFKIGFFSGLAALFYPPYFVFSLCGALCIALFARARFRHYVLIVWGLLFSGLMCALFLYALDGITGVERGISVLKQIFSSGAELSRETKIFFSFTAASVLLLIGMTKIGAMPSKYYLFLSVSLIWSLVVFSVWYFSGGSGSAEFTAQIPCLVLWLVLTIGTQKKSLARNVLFILLLLIPLFVSIFLY